MSKKLPICFAVSVLLTGCGGSGGDEGGDPSSPDGSASIPPPASIAQSFDGRYVGSISVGDIELFADALVTVGGAVRIYIGGPYSDSGVLPAGRPGEAAQFVGHLVSERGAKGAEGLVIGQQCADPNPGRFCDGTTVARIDIDGIAGGFPRRMHGTVHVRSATSEEHWPFSMAAWNNYYELPASDMRIAGQYAEELAEFAADGEFVLNIDQDEHLFFQSPATGCVGNGRFIPQRTHNVREVVLTVRSCAREYAYLNGDYDGLATVGPSNFWGYDKLLRAWLSTPAGAPAPAAVMMSGRPLDVPAPR